MRKIINGVIISISIILIGFMLLVTAKDIWSLIF